MNVSILFRKNQVKTLDTIIMVLITIIDYLKKKI